MGSPYSDPRRPRALPQGAEGVRAAPPKPTPLCALGCGDTCERYPVQSRVVLRAPLPVSEACLFRK